MQTFKLVTTTDEPVSCMAALDSKVFFGVKSTVVIYSLTVWSHCDEFEIEYYVYDIFVFFWFSDGQEGRASWAQKGDHLHDHCPV
jgi:hypothetical protein